MGKHKQKRGVAPVKHADLFDNKEYHENEARRIQDKYDRLVGHLSKTDDDFQDKQLLQDKLDEKQLVIQELQFQLDVTTKDKSAMQSVITGLENEILRLLAILDDKNEKDKIIKFSLFQIVNYCKKCVEWGDAQPIVNMLNKFLRNGGSPEDCELVDSIETSFVERGKGPTIKDSQVTFKDTTVNGCMYEVKDNEHVNLGAKCYDE